jgi:P4 family phage/plasmid primase-like protien
MSINKEHKLKKNKEELARFLQKYRISPVEKDKYKSTHTSMKCAGNTFGSYHIPSDINNELYDKVYSVAFDQKVEVSLTESHEGFKYSPLIDDIDTRDSYEDNPDIERLYTMDDIQEYCIHLVESLEKYCDLTDEQRLVFVMQKSRPVLDKKSRLVKDGWHIMMPYLVAPYELFYLARSNRIMNGSVRELFERLKYNNPIEDIIDKSVIEINNWFMYGTGKPNKEAYKVTKIFKISNGMASEISRKNAGIKDNRQLIELLSVRNKKLNVEYKKEINIKEIYDKLPDSHKSCKHVTKSATKDKKLSSRAERRKRKNEVKNKTSHNIDIIKKYVDCLSKKRANKYEDWIRVGWCLHNIDYSLLDSWVIFSKKSSKYIAGECEIEWEKMRGDGLGIGTLRLWARTDNKKMYDLIKKEDIKNILTRCIHKGITNISEYIKSKYEDEFICAGINTKEWYQFTGHRWKYIEDGWSLRARIPRDVGFDCQQLASDSYKEMIACNGSDSFEQQQKATVHQTYHKKFSELANRIGDTSLLNNIMNECKFRFYDEEFRNKLDSNDNLLHFTNGVYDLEKDEFREGYPEDYVSLSTNLEYIEEPDEYDYGVLEEIESFFEQVLPNEDVREYALTLMGSFLSGKNKEQKFYIWTGNGSNGKSMTIDLFKDCLGDYGGTISVSIFTKGRLDANAPSPAVAKLKGKRFVDLQEPEGDDKLHMGIIKQWVGGDTVQGRELNKAPIEFVMKAKFVLVCNDLPTIDSLDGGTWRRIRLLEYLSKFVDNPKKSNEFKIDRKLKDRMENWHEMFMWLLIQYHRRYKQSGIREPPAVTRVTDEYKENSDFYSQFFNEHMEKDLNAKISVKDAYKYFKLWHKSTYEGKKLVLRQNFEKHISMLMGKPKGSYWLGYQYVSPEDREDEDEDIRPPGKCKIESESDDEDNNNDNNELYTNKIEYEIINESDYNSDSDSEAEVKNVKKNKKSSKSPKGKKKKTIIYYNSESDSDSDSDLD